MSEKWRILGVLAGLCVVICSSSSAQSNLNPEPDRSVFEGDYEVYAYSKARLYDMPVAAMEFWKRNALICRFYYTIPPYEVEVYDEHLENQEEEFDSRVVPWLTRDRTVVSRSEPDQDLTGRTTFRQFMIFFRDSAGNYGLGSLIAPYNEQALIGVELLNQSLLPPRTDWDSMAKKVIPIGRYLLKRSKPPHFVSSAGFNKVFLSFTNLIYTRPD